jgi:hypothetical protein
MGRYQSLEGGGIDFMAASAGLKKTREGAVIGVEFLSISLFNINFSKSYLF